MISLPPEGARSTLLPAHHTRSVSSAHATLAVPPFLEVSSLPSELPSYLSVEHGDEFFAEAHINHLFLAQRGPYSPKWVEDKFYEVGLPLYGVLGSSAKGCGTLQRKEGDVVLLLPPLPYEGVELL